MAQTVAALLERLSATARIESDGYGRANGNGEPDNRSLDYYLKETRSSLILPEDRVIDAWRRARRGDTAAKDRLVRSNLRLVVSIARRYRNQGLDLADLISEGNYGLLRAVDHFQCDKGSKFSTYATKWIRQSITKALSDQSRDIRIPVHQVNQRRLIGKTDDFLAGELKKKPSFGEIARRLGRSQEEIEFSVAAPHVTLSLDAPTGEDESGIVSDLIGDPRADRPEDDALRHLQLLFCYRAVREVLTPRERKIIIFRFGLGGRTPLSLEETGRVMGVTREYIRQIQKRAIPKLEKYYRRHASRAYRQGIS